ncbi:hypothetical protein RCL_jg28569.t1 [Rhizophagus clarus]|uniref:Uncharacterized protein n=1 Tax=Rhizophagus clarus TaxID=94130 RepID=A0A8H3LVY2_9GLOM|nr:hypothetical protein RCL_jg28569.t1 [Rhizophagus clarus]
MNINSLQMQYIWLDKQNESLATKNEFLRHLKISDSFLFQKVTIKYRNPTLHISYLFIHYIKGQSNWTAKTTKRFTVSYYHNNHIISSR